MKKILIIVFIAFATNARTQITLEYTFDSASTIMSSGFLQDQLTIVNFEVSGERYVKICRTGHNIKIYDMNHSLIKTISFAGFPGLNANSNDFLYFSEHLFNDDNKMEFMYIAPPTSTYYYYTGIYNEDGTLIFSDTGAAEIRPNFEQQQMPIYNTSQGTKMILSYRGGKAKVFSLAGTLSQSIAESNASLLNQSYLSNPYPNPSVNSTKIDYILPDSVNDGEIVFYNLQGLEVKRFKVDKTFSTLLVSTADIAAGTYLYQLQTTAQSSEGKKMVVIK